MKKRLLSAFNNCYKTAGGMAVIAACFLSLGANAQGDRHNGGGGGGRFSQGQGGGQRQSIERMPSIRQQAPAANRMPSNDRFGGNNNAFGGGREPQRPTGNLNRPGGDINRPNNNFNRPQPNNDRPVAYNRPGGNFHRPVPGNFNRPNPGNYNNRPGGNFNNDRRPYNPRGGYYGGSYHRPAYNAYNPNWRYSYIPRRNSSFYSLPSSYFSINFGGYGYRYCDGVFYRPFGSIFRVVAPPIGIFVNTLPFGYSRIFVNDYPYYYYNGTYYDYRDDNYTVVSPPVGAVVESLPDGYETVTIDGETYYTVDGAQYKPVTQENGEIWYQVIKSN